MAYVVLCVPLVVCVAAYFVYESEVTILPLSCSLVRAGKFSRHCVVESVQFIVLVHAGDL